MSSQNGNNPVPPFVDEKAARREAQARRARSNTIVMALGWLALTMAMIGAAKLLYQYFFSDEKLELGSAIAQLVMLALAYIVGWIMSAVSIRKLQNIILPMVIQFYTYCITFAILVVYSRAVYKIFMEAPLTYTKYTVVLIVGYFLLISLHLLVNDHELGPHTVVLYIAAFLHLILAVSHYVFMEAAQPVYVVGDLYFLLFILIMAVLLQQKWLYAPLKRTLSGVFHPAY
jgi:hypothetical protein